MKNEINTELAEQFKQFAKSMLGWSTKTQKTAFNVIDQCLKSQKNPIEWITQKGVSNPVYSSTIRTYLNWLNNTEKEQYFKTPKANRDDKIAREEKSFAKRLTRQQAQQILAKCREISEEFYMLNLFCYKYGQRIGDQKEEEQYGGALDLTANRIDTSHKPARITMISKKGRWRFPDIYDLAEKVLAIKKGEKIWDFTYNWTYKTMKKIFEELQIEFHGLHCWRITFVTEKGEEGWAKEERMVFTGHETEAMLNYYDKITEERKIKNVVEKRYAEAMQGVLSPNIVK